METTEVKQNTIWASIKTFAAAGKLRIGVVSLINLSLLSLTLPHVHDVMLLVEKDSTLAWAYAFALEIGLATAAYFVAHRDVAGWARGLYGLMLVGGIGWSYALNFIHYLNQGSNPLFAGFAAAMLPLFIAILGGSLPGLTGENARRETSVKKKITELTESFQTRIVELSQSFEARIAEITKQGREWQTYAAKIETQFNQAKQDWAAERAGMMAEFENRMNERATISRPVLHLIKSDGAADGGEVSSEALIRESVIGERVRELRETDTRNKDIAAKLRQELSATNDEITAALVVCVRSVQGYFASFTK